MVYNSIQSVTPKIGPFNHHRRVTEPAPRSPRAPIHHCKAGTGLPAAAPLALPFESNCRAHVSKGFGGPTMLAVGLFGTGLPLAESLEAVIVNLSEMAWTRPAPASMKMT